MQKNALTDIQEDFAELLFLGEGYRESLLAFRKSLRKIPNHPAAPFLNEETDRLLKRLNTLIRAIPRLDGTISSVSKKQLWYFTAEKWRVFTELRATIPLISGIITATDWQSPSYVSSVNSEAGIQEGKIMANINDYKRDQHLNEAAYQEQFLKAYVDGFKFPAGAYLTSSGMAALTTIITFLTLQQKIKGPVMIGKSMYFENTELMELFFKEKNVIKVDEMNTEEILRTYDEQNPDLLLFDSLCNAPTIAVPDIQTILKHVSRNLKKETFFVIDNSTLSIALQPLKTARLPSSVKLVVFESLNKYHQFGLDRVSAGIVWYRGTGFEKLYYARDHAGTNIPDSSVASLPRPNRKYLTRRLMRLHRNTHLLAASLASFMARTKLKKIDAIIYPGLKNHPSYPWSKNYVFQGSYFVISFRKPYQNVRTYQQFVKQVIGNARKHQVSLNGGTSFGFNTTRVYLTARNTDYGQPFVRISVGTENLFELERLKDVFAETLRSF